MSLHDTQEEQLEPVVGETEPPPAELSDENEEAADLNEEERRQNLKSLAEALIFAAEEPLTEAQFLLVAGRRAKGMLKELVAELNVDFFREGRAIEILHVANGYRFFTRAEFAPALKKLFTERSRTRISRAGLETLAVVAYRGPVTRIEIDEIRGVESGGVLRTLLDRHLIAVKGRAEVVGRPLLYETTDEFLRHFGLSDLSDLPRHNELTREWGELQEARKEAIHADEYADESDQGFPDAGDAEDSSETSEPQENAARGNGHNELTPVNLENKLLKPDS